MVWDSETESLFLNGYSALAEVMPLKLKFRFRSYACLSLLPFPFRLV